MCVKQNNYDKMLAAVGGVCECVSAECVQKLLRHTQNGTLWKLHQLKSFFFPHSRSFGTFPVRVAEVAFGAS